MRSNPRPSADCTDIGEQSSTFDALMYTQASNPSQEIRRRLPPAAGKAVTILPRPTNPAARNDSVAPPGASVNAAVAADPGQGSNVAAHLSRGREGTAIQVAIAQPTATVQDTPQSKCQTNKLGSRKMTNQVEEQVLAGWLTHVDEYFSGVRRKVFKKIALSLNDIIHEPPFFTEKQVENKITYMEKRYRTVKEKYAASGYSLDDLNEKHLRTQVERAFPLFFKVNQVIGGRTKVDPTDEDGGHGNSAETASKRGRKRKRAANGAVADDGENENQVSGEDHAVTEVFEDSDNLVDLDAGSVGSPRQRLNLTKGKKEIIEVNKSFRKKSAGRRGSSLIAEELMKQIATQMVADDKHRNEVLRMMRTEVELRETQVAAGKESLEQSIQMTKVQEMRKIAELYVKLDEKEKAKSILQDAQELLGCRKAP
eukprot:GFKZ01016166.1.p1 GENE.GFKZ01016166.1~~GFKZ01016166.1.p1  ORF type:complete len:426 (+),score=82.04 GFKZ01016166.1:232-1509(+)